MTRAYKKTDLKNVVQLLNTCFPKNNVTTNSFSWKHFHSIFSNQTRCRVAIVQDQLAAVACFLPLKIQHGQKTLRFFSCAVQATNPAYRRQGLITKLTQEIEAELPIDTNYLGFSNSDGVKIDQFSKKINYKIVGTFSTSYFLPFFRSDKKFQFKEVSSMQKRFIPQSQGKFLEIDANVEYVQWKFVENPKRTYLFFEIHNKEKCVGYVITENLGWKIAIVKIIAAVKYIQPQLFESFSNYIWSNTKRLTVFSYLKNSFWQTALPHSLFSKPSNMYLTVKSKKKIFVNKDNWLLQGGDIQ